MYRLYGPSVPQLGQDDWGIDWSVISGAAGSLATTAIDYAQKQQQADMAAAAAEAQQEAIAAQVELVKQQTLCSRPPGRPGRRWLRQPSIPLPPAPS
jgi:hypothetical protein